MYSVPTFFQVGGSPETLFPPSPPGGGGGGTLRPFWVQPKAVFLLLKNALFLTPFFLGFLGPNPPPRGYPRPPFGGCHPDLSFPGA